MTIPLLLNEAGEFQIAACYKGLISNLEDFVVSSLNIFITADDFYVETIDENEKLVLFDCKD